MKISTFIVGILLVSLFSSILANYYAHIADEYDVAYDSSTNASLQAYNQFAAIRNVTQDINQTLFSAAQGGSGTTDLLGKLLGSGYYVIKVSTGSFTAFYALMVNMVEAAGLPGYVLNIFLAIVVVIIFFIIVSTLVGKDV